jgi:ribose 1,5-bisphosphokinase
MGNLFYFIGASGAGKDSLMNYARSRINGSLPVIFAHRYITRHPGHSNENHIYISPEEFQLRRDGGLFAMDWESHGQYYGIGREIDGWMEKGFHVVVNGSRQYLQEAHRRYGHLKVILVEARPDTIRKRLENRGREGSPDIEKRISRSGEIGLGWENGASFLRIRNDGLLEDAGEELIRMISPTLLRP